MHLRSKYFQKCSSYYLSYFLGEIFVFCVPFATDVNHQIAVALRLQLIFFWWCRLLTQTAYHAFHQVNIFRDCIYEVQFKESCMVKGKICKQIQHATGKSNVRFSLKTHIPFGRCWANFFLSTASQTTKISYRPSVTWLQTKLNAWKRL